MRKSFDGLCGLVQSQLKLYNDNNGNKVSGGDFIKLEGFTIPVDSKGTDLW